MPPPSAPRIPQTAHFVFGLWDSGEPPFLFRQTMASWRAQGWQTRLWGRDDVFALIEAEPRIACLCRGFRRRVQVADVARYMIVQREGGFYFDGDCVPGGQSLLQHVAADETAEAYAFVQTVQPESWPPQTAVLFPIRRGIAEHRERLENCAFGAVAGHPALQNVLDLLVQRSEENSGRDDDYDILYKTGPDCVTDALQPVRRRYPELRVLDHRPFMVHLMAGGWRHRADSPDRGL